MKRYYIIPIFVPHQGCPHDCVFCNQHSITGYQQGISAQEVRLIIEQYLATFPRNAGIHKEIAFYGGSFTGIPQKEQEQLLAIAAHYKEQGLVDGVRISTRPDYINSDILRFLQQYAVTTIELGVQSLDDAVLSKSQRGHSSHDVMVAVQLIRQFGFTLGLQMMIGLPGDAAQKTIVTARAIASLQPDFVRIYPTVVIEGTQLASLYRQGRYTPLTLDEAIEQTAAILLIFQTAGIAVIRVGLQPTAELCSDQGIIAGPFHPAFRELVESQIAYGLMLYLIRELPVLPKEVVFRVHPRHLSTALGHKKANITKLASVAKINRIIIGPDDTVDRGDIVLHAADGNTLNIQLTKAMFAQLSGMFGK